MPQSADPKKKFPDCRPVLPLLERQEDYSNDGLYETLSKYVSEKGYKTGYVMWPLRTAVSGRQMTPAGATDGYPPETSLKEPHS